MSPAEFHVHSSQPVSVPVLVLKARCKPRAIQIIRAWQVFELTAKGTPRKADPWRTLNGIVTLEASFDGIPPSY
jgi:hypothetical protein